ncbi:hypothetical protein OH809_44965 (plasmid) [Streptomyces sp. NBC_00873]|nr:hypothetical protein OH809_44965 [Streptomyces sp. NBC_00873]WTA49411.1 hypothetical protein OH821_44990 [Streptomyces sp. NBC_00842]
MRSRLGGYAFAALTLLAIYADMTGPAVVCAALTALTWKGSRSR